MGFGADIESKQVMDLGNLLKQIQPEDLLKFGLIPEFVGRLPVVVTLDQLDEEALVQILTEPKNALTKQYKRLFEIDGVLLELEEEALIIIAKKAIERKTGARGLRGIIEGIMMDIMYEIPSRDDIERVIITKDTVVNGSEPKIILKKADKTNLDKKDSNESAS